MALRKIEPMLLPDVTPSDDIGAPPTFIDVSPIDLVVDEDYQRQLSRRGVNLIRKILWGWDWARFKPPVVTRIGETLHVIDGQHTAIAAASHPNIPTIPVMLVDAPAAADRAEAFVGHNRDRVNVTAAQLHHAMVTAGDEDALTVEEVCARAGVKLLRAPPNDGEFDVGDCMALGSIRAVINQYGPIKARQTLQALVEAKCAPVTADFIKAGAELLWGHGYEGAAKPEDLTNMIRAVIPKIEEEARQMAIAKKLPRWRALVIVLYQRRTKRAARSGS
ncbi:DUF6551 family protein [uncultured Alsobacter sp.]|uniref:DUF6551 family protein n=1 Tax=uncultured Alsobacter sp. TaxID=1748258 RepID=UPI0025CD1820|nr:DUF6551 family protein [uncultured Alsobacter sp.]